VSRNRSRDGAGRFPPLDPSAPSHPTVAEGAALPEGRRGRGRAAHSHQDGDSQDSSGRHLGSYLLLHKIGEGGMGTVYEARHVQIERRVALKVMTPRAAVDEVARSRFLNEAKAANRVEHRNIVEIYDVGQSEDGTLFMVMELLSGMTLAQKLTKHPQGVGQAESLRIGFEIADALTSAHEKGIVHRDLSTSNIMLVPGANADAPTEIKLLDFGIAKLLATQDGEDQGLTLTGQIFGNPSYMAPEQWQPSKPVDSKADVFTLALVLCELLTGLRPFDGYTNALLREDPPALRLPSSPVLRELLRHMLSAEPAQRPTMAEVRSTLARFRRPRRRLLLPAMALLLLLGLLCFAAGHYLVQPKLLTFAEIQQRNAALAAAARQALEDGLKSPDPEVRLYTVSAIGLTVEPTLAPLVLPLLDDRASEPSRNLALAAAHALGQLASPESRDKLHEVASLPAQEAVQLEAAAALLMLRDPRGKKILNDALGSQTRPLRLRAARRLCEQHIAQGCEALSAELGTSLAAADVTWLGLLAGAGSQAALVALQERAQSGPVAQRSGAVYQLATLRGLGDVATSARRQMEQRLAAGDSTAASYLALLGSDAGFELLRSALKDVSLDRQQRCEAATALARSARLDSLPELEPLVRDRSQPGQLRSAAAAAVLRLIGADPVQTAKQASRLAQRLTGDPRGLSLEDALLLADNDSEVAANRLFELAKNGEGETRQFAIIAIGRRTSLRSVGALLAAVNDASPEVQAVAMRSLQRLLAKREQRGDKDLDGALSVQLQQLSSSSAPREQALAASIRLRLGDSSQLVRLRGMLGSATDVRTRELVVELASAGSPLLIAALANSEPSVKFRAALALADAGSARGRPVLEQALQAGGANALAAYRLFKRLKWQTPADLRLDWAQVLINDPLWLRFAAVGDLVDLPVDEALPLLRLALGDPAAVVRRQVADVTVAFYRQQKLSALQDILRALLKDEEIAVRSHTAWLLNTLDSPSPPPEPAVEPKADSQRPTAVPAADMAVASSPAPAVAPVTAARPTPSHVPPPPSRPTAADVPAYGVDELRQAQKQLNTKKYRDAMLTLQELAECPPQKCSREVVSKARQLFEQYKTQLGAYRIKNMIDGKCQWERKETWRAPGAEQITRHNETRNVEIRRGQITPVDFCQ